MKKSKKIIFVICFLGVLFIAAFAYSRFARVYNNSYSIKNDEQSINDNMFIGSVEKFKGKDTIWTYDAKNEMDINVGYMFELKKGNVKLLHLTAIGGSSEIVNITDNTSSLEMNYTNIHLKKGKNYIKLVSDDYSQFDWQIEIDEGTFGKLGD